MSTKDILTGQPKPSESAIDADFVLIFDASINRSEVTKPASTLEQQYSSLLRTLRQTGLQATGRPGAPNTNEILIFVKATEGRLYSELQAEGLNDWFHGVTSMQRPDPKDNRDFIKNPVTPAERLRIVYQLINGLPIPDPQNSAACAGVVPNSEAQSI